MSEPLDLELTETKITNKVLELGDLMLGLSRELLEARNRIKELEEANCKLWEKLPLSEEAVE